MNNGLQHYFSHIYEEKNDKIIQPFFIHLSNSWFSFHLVFESKKNFTRKTLNSYKANELIHLSFFFYVSFRGPK